MSGVADVPDGVMMPRREVVVSPAAMLEDFKIADMSILDSLSERRR